jgi:hypothetical protein
VVSDSEINKRIADAGTIKMKEVNEYFAKLAEQNGVFFFFFFFFFFILISKVDPLFFNAPTVIYITYRLDSFETRLFDLGLAGENIMVAAYLLGLGTVPLGYPRFLVPELVKTELKIPDAEDFYVAIALGYPDPSSTVDYYKLIPKLESRFTDNAVFIE